MGYFPFVVLFVQNDEKIRFDVSGSLELVTII